MTAIQLLNFHHLRYFWFVAREGGLAQAGRVLRLSHPTPQSLLEQVAPRELRKQLALQL